MRAKLVATGGCVPERVIQNADLTQFPSGALHLIEAKTGIKTRRHAAPDQCASDLAITAARMCLERAGLAPDRLDAIVLATSSPDRIQPATATRVQHGIGASRAFAFDINSVCSGAVYAICLADSLIRAGTCGSVLVIGAEVYSKFLNPSDFSTYPYFGDGAGAALFCADADDRYGVRDSVLHSDGSGADLVQIPAGGARLPIGQVSHDKDCFFQMDGKAVYSFATSRAPEVIGELLARTAVDREAVRFVITHQANLNIVREIASKVGIDFSRFIVNLDRYGNTAAASILLALDELSESGTVNDGDLLVTVGFGGGLAWGANLISLTKREVRAL